MGQGGKSLAFAVVAVTYFGTVHQAQVHRDAHSDCRTQSAPVRVKVDVSKYPENWRHIVDARNGRNTGPDGKTVINDGLRWPRVLVKNSRGEDARREAAFAMSGLKAKAGKARDEYPPAFGRSTNAADIRYVARKPNSRQGASMGNQMRPYCDGQSFVPVAVP